MLYRKDFGGVLSPKNAWPILVYGLPTLAARMVNQQKSAMQVAEFLLRQPPADDHAGRVLRSGAHAVF
jgi:cystathionine beta-lyase/cystathionine gamma-synthase